jgi:ParB/RepB/Spo0J family partition protein
MKKKNDKKIEKTYGEVFLDGDLLVTAPWNPRTEAELAADHPEMQKLLASIRARGVLQPIVIWEDAPGDAAFVIAGCRRFTAAKLAGLEAIPAVKFEGLSEAEAREITRIENEVRFGVSPLKDAELIADMTGKFGYSVDEVAAHFGISSATVRRRARLMDLVPEIREIAEQTGSITTDALEKIALYPVETQLKCADSIGKTAKSCANHNEKVKWGAIKWDFERTTTSLDDAKFDTSGCVGCLKRSGAQGDLWGDVPEGSLGVCLDCECFKEKKRAALLEKARQIALESAKGEAFELIDGDENEMQEWQTEREPYAKLFGEKRTKSRPAAWFWVHDYTGEVSVVWGPDNEAWAKIVAAEDARIEREKAEREKNQEAYRKESKKRGELVEATEEAFDEGLREKIEVLSLYGPDEELADFDDLAERMHGSVALSQGDELVVILALALRGLGSLYDADDYDTAVDYLAKSKNLAKILNIDKAAIEKYQKAARALQEFEDELKARND